ncbi:MBL fold metallo-hydrolase [Helicobacter typhlonius]|uniref:ComEC/Rec2 family competence protein n=1 Tax=Helicobacter typhlonius TaxID=76936 RepID=UPI002FE0459B
MSNFGYEIDFLPVGNGSSGDAIAVRYGIAPNYKVMVVDGGTKESGIALVNHIQKYYKTSRVDYVVNTHPDKDHASGLTEVLENLKVGELWLHRPWLYIKNIVQYVDNSQTPFLRDKRTTIESIKRRFEEEYYKYARELEKIAEQKDIPIKEPYEGAQIGEFYVLSPNKEWHLFNLIPNSNKTQEIATEGSKVGILESMKEIMLLSVKEKLKFKFETLKDYKATTRENESSVILYANFNGRGILLTGDAGKESLQRAYNFAMQQQQIGNISQNLNFIQIPHHGSRRNISPQVLNQIIGKKPKDSITAFVSAGKNDEKHPRRVVTNAFIRRGCKVVATQGSAKHHHRNMPERKGWTTAEPIPFYPKVESYD